ncbi:hypothetical protein M569_12361, partial [Genlisea aurea]
YWEQRGNQARRDAVLAFDSNPYQVSNDRFFFFSYYLNENRSVMELDLKRSRRSLKEDGGCTATNPIDRCWRCRDDWSDNRQRLADCAIGFGRKTTGGKGGRIYTVNDSSDGDLVNPKEGTLRHAVIQSEPLWIVFSSDMTIRLSEELIMTSNKTIDGRGRRITIAGGAGITLQYVSNVILHNLRIHDIKPGSGGTIRDSPTHFGFRTPSDGDAISMFGATNIWIDHVSAARCSDGLIDAIQASTAITISNCHFAQHNDVMLLGASDKSSEDQILQVTLAFNHFGTGLIQRMPRIRWGFVHIVNNDYTKWEMYAIGGSQHPTILSQGNRFHAPDNAAAKEVTKREYSPESVWKNWNWKSQGDSFSNGAFFVESGDKNFNYVSDSVGAKSGKEVGELTEFAGPLACFAGKAC